MSDEPSADLTAVPPLALRLLRDAVGCGAVLDDAVIEQRSEVELAALDEVRRGAETAALEAGDSAWGGPDDEESPASQEEREQRRGSLARMHAGLSPMVAPHEVTYDDEGPDGVAVPINWALPSGGSWNPPAPETREMRLRREAEEARRAAGAAEYHRELAEQHGRPVRFEVMEMPGGSAHPYDRKKKATTPSFVPFKPRKPRP